MAAPSPGAAFRLMTFGDRGIIDPDNPQGKVCMDISFDDFLKVDIRVGTIARTEPFPEDRKPAIKVWVDFGPELGQKRTAAQITRHYTEKDVVGRQVVRGDPGELR